MFSLETGVAPVLIVDGHESRINYEFLSYVNNLQHKWYVCLGVPYATSYWQVGDSHEQNGSFKVNWYCAKRKVMSWKNDQGLGYTMTAREILPVINDLWEMSYNQ